MRAYPRIRKTVKWGGLVVTVLLVAAWIGSVFWWVAWNKENWEVRLSGGSMLIENTSSRSRVFPTVMYGQAAVWRQHPWWPSWSFTPWYERVQVPVWVLVFPALVITMAAWRINMLARRGTLTPLCRKCGYDRTGLSPETVCPECGTLVASESA